MSSIHIDPYCRRRIQPRWTCRNGQIVSAHFQQDLCQLTNQIARYRGKQLFCSSGDVTSLVENKVWRFAGQIGPMTGAVIAEVVMAPADHTLQEHNPNIYLELVNSSGAVVAGGRAHFGYSYGITPDEAPQEWGVATIALNVVSPTDLRNTAIRGTLTANEEARPISCVVYEYALAPDTDNGYIAQSFSIGSPILDADRRAPIDMLHDMYKHGAAPCFGYSSDTDATAPTNSQAVYRNIIDDSSAASRTTITPGLFASLPYNVRKTKTTVSVKVEAFAAMAGGGTGSVRVVSFGGTVVATLNFTSATGEWQSATGELAGGETWYYIEHVGDGVNAIATYACSVYQYTA